MVIFNEAYLTNDFNHLVLDVQIDPQDFYKDIKIESIQIDTQANYNPLGPSDKVINNLCRSDLDTKHFRETFDVDMLSNSIFFIWVITSGEYQDGTPCSTKDTYHLCVIYNPYVLYKQGMNYITGNECYPSQQFIDFMLKNYAFELAIKTGNYTKAIEYWERYFNNQTITNYNTCGCHGVA